METRAATGNSLGQLGPTAPFLAFPTPFPGEFFGGILLRYHRLYGVRRLSHTLVSDLGLGRGVIRNLPTGLGRFAERTAPVWPGGVDQILEEHTVWPVYRPFLTALSASRAYHRIVNGPSGSLQLTLGDATSRLRLQPYVQGCPVCLAEDALHCGYGYLHVEHQLPGVNACHRHRIALIAASPGDDLDFEQNWRPDAGRIDTASPKMLQPGMVEFAALAAALHTAHIPRLTPKLLALAYLERLRALRLVTMGGHLRSQALAKAVVVRYSGPMLTQLGVSRRAIANWMPSMLNRQQRGHHPIKHLLLIGTLFGDIEAFLEALPQRELPFNAPHVRPVKRDIGAEVAAELMHKNSTMTNVARRLGVSITTCTTYAKRAGAKVHLRPKSIGAARIRRLASKLARGESIGGICKLEQVSVSTVYRVIKSDKSIEQRRKMALERKLRKKHRTAWEQQLGQVAKTASAARRRIPDVYAWLYRHDQVWLRNSVNQHRISGSSAILPLKKK